MDCFVAQHPTGSRYLDKASKINLKNIKLYPEPRLYFLMRMLLYFWNQCQEKDVMSKARWLSQEITLYSSSFQVANWLLLALFFIIFYLETTVVTLRWFWQSSLLVGYKSILLYDFFFTFLNLLGLNITLIANISNEPYFMTFTGNVKCLVLLSPLWKY